MRLRTVASEAVLGLRRNLVMSVAAIVTVAVSLAFVGTGLLVSKTVGEIRQRFYTQIDISIFLKEDVTAQQRDAVRTTLQDTPQVRNIIYEDKAEAFRRFKLQFQDQPDLLANVTQDALPESFRVKLKDPRQYEAVASAVGTEPGVDQVVDYRRFLDQLFGVLDGLREAALIAALVLLLASTLLIGNTVRVAAFSRRREIGVMRLVGATRTYIQLPFLLEGITTGVIGAGVSIGLLFLSKRFILDEKLGGLFRNGVVPRVTAGEIASVTPWLVLAGVVISGLASLVTLQRYVKV